MNTFKAGLTIAKRYKSTNIIYLVIMAVMLGIAYTNVMSTVNTSTTSTADALASDKVNVAIVNRDTGADRKVVEGLQTTLKKSNTLVSVHDDKQSMQQALITNQVSTIIIIPQGFSNDFVTAAKNGTNAPKVEFANLSSGSSYLVQMQVQGYLSSLRMQLIGNENNTVAQNVSAVLQSGNNDKTVVVATKKNKSPGLTVENSMVKTSFINGTYPLLFVLIILIITVMSNFNRIEVKRRILVSPIRYQSRYIQLWCVAGVIGLIGCAANVIAAAYMSYSIYNSFDHISWNSFIIATISALVFTVSTVSFAMLLVQFNIKQKAASVIANMYSLISAFICGVWISQSMMPSLFTTIGKVLPAWWYISSVNNAFGIDASDNVGAINYNLWAQNMGMLALY
ncbi:MAG: ABC transporter permease, partial [Bifidobacteriaceae bacterium]|nr:ABC transporter permease [Bifidobacteriaceae bacterium]